MHHVREAKRIPWIVAVRSVTTKMYISPPDKQATLEQENGELKSIKLFDSETRMVTPWSTACN